MHGNGMIVIKDSIANSVISFRYVETQADADEAYAFAKRYLGKWLALDTESTGLNCYHPDWLLRLFQFGNAKTCYLIPAKRRKLIAAIARLQIKWIGHNGAHDIRCIDAHLGFDTGVVCRGETFLPAHYDDPRGVEQGGIGHGLKEQAIRHIDPMAGKWEVALKQSFREIRILKPGEVYKSGPRRGEPKTRAATLAEGWKLHPVKHPAYIAYAGADPILTFRLWRHYRGVRQRFSDLYKEIDHPIAQAVDKLQRRAILLDVDYTTRYREALTKAASKAAYKAQRLGCKNIYSGQQIASALLALGAPLYERTAKGAWKTDDGALSAVLEDPVTPREATELIHAILLAKRLTKRRDAYADGMLREADVNGRVHASIKALGAVTTRMSVSNPPLQQLPTRENEES